MSFIKKDSMIQYSHQDFIFYFSIRLPLQTEGNFFAPTSASGVDRLSVVNSGKIVLAFFLFISCVKQIEVKENIQNKTGLN